MNETKRTALIIGGGIAGPALALFLKRQGIEPLVFEAYPRSENVGGGFQIAPNGMGVLEDLGLAEAVTLQGSPARGFCFRNHRGKAIGRMAMNRVRPAVTISRAPFYELLLDEVARQGVKIQYSKRLSHFSEDDRGVVAHFDDGSSAHGDFLVGADGVHSRVRGLMFAEAAKARYTGFLGLGAFVKSATAAPADPADGHQLVFVLGPRLQFGYGRMDQAGEERWGWWCHLAQEKELSRAEVATWKRVIRVLSHELNNSLVPISSLAHSGAELARRGDTARLPQVLASIGERAAHLHGFLSGYASFAKLPAPRREPVAWPPFLARLATLRAFRLDSAPPMQPGWFDPAQVEQALLNLVKNAHESGSDPDEIALRLTQVGGPGAGGWRIEVLDRGPGMSEAVLAQALLPFYSTKRHGTGLGLALAREIVEAHGGRLRLANREGGGLCVTLVLPGPAPLPV